MMGLRLAGLLFVLAGSGCLWRFPAGMEVTPAGMVPGQDDSGQDIDLLFHCRFDPGAQQTAKDDLRPGQEVQVIVVDRRGGEMWSSEGISLKMTVYAGAVQSVSADAVVLQDVVWMFEGRSAAATASMRDQLTIPLDQIGGAFELSDAGVQKLQQLRRGEDIAVR